ncbi:MAG: Gfo/Idh/MocA family oxidoreductase [Ruminococcaceae bacterium]|nr:Gfo/Idh/MocA family oxidoreductase [Oscillospiraceae bacterium]
MHRIAFIGFKHGHIFSLYAQAEKHPDIIIAGACEVDPAYRKDAEAKGVVLTHDQPAALLADSSIDIIAIGDAFALRGGHAIAALQAGKHVIADKPLCTSLQELAEIRRLAAEKKRQVGMMLDLRFSPITGAVRSLLQDKAMGPLQAAFFSGQHPLNYATRAPWYFEPNMHGGTINDLAIHGMDMMACLTGLRLQDVLAARCWNAYADKDPDFKDCAQFMVKLDQGAGLLADVSYSAPDSMGYSLPSYWRFTLWCKGGVIEFSYGQPEIRLSMAGEAQPRLIPIPEQKTSSTSLQALLDDIAGKSAVLDTATVLQSSEDTLKIQAAADQSDAG